MIMETRSLFLLVVVSDTHGHQRNTDVLDGDVWVHANDFSVIGFRKQIADCFTFFISCSRPHKIVVAGNQDILFQRALPTSQRLLAGLTLFQDFSILDNSLIIRDATSLRILQGWSFNIPHWSQLNKECNLILVSTLIYSYHSMPPYSINDSLMMASTKRCKQLRHAKMSIE